MKLKGPLDTSTWIKFRKEAVNLKVFVDGTTKVGGISEGLVPKIMHVRPMCRLICYPGAN